MNKHSDSGNFKDFIKNNEKHQDLLKKLTEPLKTNFEIDKFWHLTLQEDGLFSNISNHFELWEYYWETKCYNNTQFFIAPSQLKAGYHLLEFDTQFKKVQDTLQRKQPLNHPFIIIRKEGNTKAHVFGFGTSYEIPTLPSFYSNNLHILNKYIDYFSNTDLFLKRTSEENMINIAEMRGHKNYYGRKYGEKVLPEKKRNVSFLKQIGIDSTLLSAADKLTRREKEVLIACIEWKTAAQNGEELGLSSRTIQSYIENTKNKLGINSREKLIENGQILKMAGIL